MTQFHIHTSGFSRDSGYPRSGLPTVFLAIPCRSALVALGLLAIASTVHAQIAVRGERIHTMAGPVIEDGIIVIRDGKISALGQANEIAVPDGYRVVEGKVVIPGLIDAHATVGVSGLFNYAHDQDQLERTEPIQPELRAMDAYNAHEDLVGWVRQYGVTTVHTGHAPGELVSGQTMVRKTKGNTVEQFLLIPARAVAVTLSSDARKQGQQSPGTRGKMIAMLRSELTKAQEYLAKKQAKRDSDDDDAEPPATSLRLEALGDVLSGKMALLVTADRAQDIVNAIRLADEFKVELWLDSAAESYLLIDEIQKAGVPVIVHPTMARAVGDRENLSFETAGKLVEAGIPVALQSGYESYVPKTRVVLFEAALAAAHGLTFEQALATVTIDAAKILGIQDRVGSIEIGKDGDLAIYDGDPFEYTTHCTGVIVEGELVSDGESVRVPVHVPAGD